MERFAVKEQSGYRSYSFLRPPDSEGGKDLQQAQKTGQLVSVNGPAALFGRSSWSGLPEGSCRIVRALTREVTRSMPRGKSKRPDAAHVLHGQKVPGDTPKARIVCPVLDHKGRYVAFCGNGKRWGMGYQIVGVKGTGWLDRCGYAIPEDNQDLAKVIRSFLKDLREVSEALGFTVVGLKPNTAKWLDLGNMVQLSRVKAGLEELLRIHLRVYGPEDYLQRWRSYFAQKGGFTSIPGGEEDAQPSAPSDLNDLSTRIRLAGIKQVELARHLGVSQPYVCQLLNNDRPWPDQARKRAEAFLQERTGSWGLSDVAE
jgi:hypothetical protein